jgi:uncharacterized protein (TIRG00374 family)
MRALKLSFSLALSVFFLYLTFFVPALGALLRGESSLGASLFGHPRFEPSQFEAVLRDIHWGPILLTGLVFFASLALRAWRWHLILSPIVDMKFGYVFGAMNIGYMANNVLPFRMGEVYRAQVVYQLTGLSRAAAFGTVVLERLVDLVFMIPYVGLAVLMYPLPGALRDAAYVLSAASFGLTVFFVWTALDRERVMRIVARIFSLLPRRTSTLLTELVGRFTSALAVLGRRQMMISITLSSLALWAMYGLMVYLVMQSLGFIGTDLPLIDQHLVGAVLVTLIITTAGFVIPGAPGSVGTYHGVAVMGLSLFNVPGDRAAGFAFLLHGLNYVPLTILGLIYFWKYGLTFRGAKMLSEKVPDTADAEQAMAEAARTK